MTFYKIFSTTLILGILFSQVLVFSQNLIRNGNFEMGNSIGQPAYWHVGSGTADYFDNPKKIEGWGRILSKTQPSFVGEAFNDKWQEFLITNLKKELVPTKEYSISLDLFLELACNPRFDTLFLMMSTDTIIDKSDFLLEIPITHVAFAKWTRIQKDFTVDREIKYFALGCFEQYSKNIKNRQRPKIDLNDMSTLGCSYMFYDNVNLIPFERQEIEVDQKLTYQSIYFDTKKFIFPQDAIAILNKIKVQFQENPNLRLELVGYTDDVGSLEQNYRLSNLRVQSVKKELIKLGVLEHLIFTKALGEISINDSINVRNERAKNRRVDIKIIPSPTIQSEVKEKP